MSILILHTENSTDISRGESGVGTWTLIVKDSIVNENNGTFTDWHLKLWGESIDASKSVLLPMPTEQDDDNHDEIVSTTSITGTTTSVGASLATSSITANPTDHPDRPTKPTADPTQEEETTPTGSPTPSATPSSWLPSFLPTFHASPKTQIWIYGALALILAFGIGLSVYFYLARRKRLLNNPRDEWEFDLLEEDETEGLTGGGKKGGKRRAGELYDAFAAGSEDESEGEKEGYEDESEEEGGSGSGSGSGQHVVGDDSDDEKEGQGGRLLHK